MTVTGMLSERLIDLHRLRKAQKAVNAGRGRPHLTRRQREAVLAKTGAKCHICGGEISGPWQADGQAPGKAPRSNLRSRRLYGPPGAEGKGILKIARELGVGVSVVQRVVAE